MSRSAEPTMRRDEGLRWHASAIPRWFLLDGDRRVVAGVILLVAATIFAVCLEPFDRISTNQPAFYALSGLIAGNLALISIVIAIDQLVLSRELVTPGERLETIEEVSSFRDRVAETTGEYVLPITAPKFLDVILTSALEEARRIDTDSADLDSLDRRRVDDLVDAIVESVETIDTVFEDEDVRPFTALVRALHVDYGKQLQTIGRLRTSDSIPASIDDRLSVLHDHLVLIDVGRQYFRTLYIQRELPRISRSLLYVGGPAELVLVGVSFAFMTAPSHAKVLALVAGIAGFVPLAVLISYIVRISIVAELTATVVPFVGPTPRE